MAEGADLEELIDTLKIAVAALRDAEIPFMLGGSVAAWARGGPAPRKDLDLMVKPDDAHRAQSALVATGMRPEQPPEEWLLKAYHEDVLVDIIFGPSGLELTDEVITRADIMPVMAIAVPVMAIDDMLITMLMALDEHCLDYGPLLGITRALREQIDWPWLRAHTATSPYAKAFFTLVEELGISPAAPAPPGAPGVRGAPAAPQGPAASEAEGGTRGHSRVRVVR